MSVKNKWLTLTLGSALLGYGCGGGSKSDSSTSTPTTTPSASSGSASSSSSSSGSGSTLALAGTAQGYVTSAYTSVGSLNLALTDSENTCSTGKYEVYGLGYSEAFSSGDIADSQFKDVKVPKGDAWVKVTCADGSLQKCFAKAGDSGIVCNKTASFLVDAFTSALGKDLSDSTFRTAVVAKIASSIVDASLLNSAENDALIADLKTCESSSDKNTCAAQAFQKSSLFDAFKVMQKAATGWDQEGLFLFVTGVLGKEIYLDDMLYGQIFDTLAEVRGDGFIEGIRDLIAKVVTSQKAQDGKYAFAIKCLVEINSDKKYFDPDLDAKSHLSCNRKDLEEILTSAGIPNQYFDDIAAGNMRDSVSCTVANAHDNQCWTSISMVATSIMSTEPNRNDIDGTHTSSRGDSDRGVSLVDVMPQIMVEIQNAKIPVGDGGSETLTAEQQATFKTIMEKTQKYFIGLMGIYSFLNGAYANQKLSLNDIHDIFVGEGFMRNRLTSWGPKLMGVQVGDRWTSPLLTPTSTENEFIVDDVFIWSGSNNSNSISSEKFDSLFADSEPSFASTFKMFTHIPTAKEINDFVYNSSHHEDWNPMGSKYLYVAQLGSTSKPIACNLNNPGPGQSLVSGTTATCDASASDVTCTEDGYCTFPTSYSYPYILMERGWFGDDQGRLFAFASRSTGLELQSNGGRGVLIKEYKSGNPSGRCDSSQVGSVIKYVEEFYCGDNLKCEEKITAFCMDMSALGTPARKRFYPGGQLTVSNQDADGNKWEWNVPLIGAYDGSNHRDDYPVCLHVPSGTFTSGSSSLATSHINTSDGIISLSGVSGAAIKNCSDSADSGNVKYYLYNWNDFGDDTMYAWLMDADQNSTLQFTNTATNDRWETTYARISQASIEALLSGKTVAGSAATQINGMRYHNPRHDSKFDPYCDDLDGNGACDCFALKTMSADGKTLTFESTKRSDPEQCGLLDKAAEPTISELPYCAQCSNSADAKSFFTSYGGKAGADLAGVKTYFESHNINFNIQAAVFCQFKFAGQSQVGQPKYIDWQHWDQATHPGCPAAEGETRADNSQGTIRIINPKSMRNAYNVGRPNTLIKLINYATKSVGQGVDVDPAADVFSMDEAMALVAVRSLLPPEIMAVKDSSGNELDGLSPGFQSIASPSKDSDPVSSMLKGIMFKAGIYTQEDLDVEAPNDK